MLRNDKWSRATGCKQHATTIVMTENKCSRRNCFFSTAKCLSRPRWYSCFRPAANTCIFASVLLWSCRKRFQFLFALVFQVPIPFWFLLFACRACKFASIFAVRVRACKFAFHLAFSLCASHLQVCFVFTVCALQVASFLFSYLLLPSPTCSPTCSPTSGLCLQLRFASSLFPVRLPPV